MPENKAVLGLSITRKMVDDYYYFIRNLIIPELKMRNIALWRVNDFFQRHYQGGGWIRVNNEEEFLNVLSMGVIEFIPETNFAVNEDLTDRVVIDLDAKGEVSFDYIKSTAAELYDGLLERFQGVSYCALKFSGSRGFHVIGMLKTQSSIMQLRGQLKEFLNSYVDASRKYTAPRAETNYLLMDLSIMRRHGPCKVFWSLHKSTGYSAVFVPRSHLMSFVKSEANLILKSKEEIAVYLRSLASDPSFQKLFLSRR